MLTFCIIMYLLCWLGVWVGICTNEYYDKKGTLSMSYIFIALIVALIWPTILASLLYINLEESNDE